LQAIQEAATKIRGHVDSIERQAATGVEKLGKLGLDARKTLLALKVELREDDLEREAPIGLPAPANDAHSRAVAPNSMSAVSAE
jgi:hypothetical protein